MEAVGPSGALSPKSPSHGREGRVGSGVGEGATSPIPGLWQRLAGLDVSIVDTVGGLLLQLKLECVVSVCGERVCMCVKTCLFVLCIG